MDDQLFIDYVGEEWYEELKSLLNSDYFRKLGRFICDRREKEVIYPATGLDIFKAFRTTPLSKMKGVVLGQDPYHDGSYDGLCFSNSHKTRPSPSLRNILKEVNRDIYDNKNEERRTNYSLYNWAEQGLLMINTTLTVPQGRPDAHYAMWKKFTNHVINVINKQDDIVWMLWGNRAQEYIPLIKNTSHGTIRTSHPSPLGANHGIRPFNGSGCFSEFNVELEARNKRKIVW